MPRSRPGHTRAPAGVPHRHRTPRANPVIDGLPSRALRDRPSRAHTQLPAARRRRQGRAPLEALRAPAHASAVARLRTGQRALVLLRRPLRGARSPRHRDRGRAPSERPRVPTTRQPDRRRLESPVSAVRRGGGLSTGCEVTRAVVPPWPEPHRWGREVECAGCRYARRALSVRSARVGSRQAHSCEITGLVGIYTDPRHVILYPAMASAGRSSPSCSRPAPWVDARRRAPSHGRWRGSPEPRHRPPHGPVDAPPSRPPPWAQ